MKFIGKIVFAYYAEDESEPGIYEEQYVEKSYRGDVLRKTVRSNNANTINNNVTTSTRLSILADQFALTHFGSIRYAEYMGQKWTVDSVEVQLPRLILELGSLYHENGGVINGNTSTT